MSSGEVYAAPAGDCARNAPAPASGLDLPSVDQVLQSLPQISTSLLSRDAGTIDSDEQKKMFLSLKNIIENSQGTAADGSSLDLKEFHASLEQADADARRGRNLETLRSVHTTINRLWSCNSQYLAQAAEVLANGSRDREFRTIPLFTSLLTALSIMAYSIWPVRYLEVLLGNCFIKGRA